MKVQAKKNYKYIFRSLGTINFKDNSWNKFLRGGYLTIGNSGNCLTAVQKMNKAEIKRSLGYKTNISLY